MSCFTLSLATLSQLTGQPKGAAEALVRHVLNWGPEEKAPPKQGLKCTGITLFAEDGLPQQDNSRHAS